MLESAVLTLTSLLFVVDPWGTIPAFLVMTAGDSPQKRRHTAAKATLTATAALALFALAGSDILRLFGISLPAFRIAGGIILFIVALDMMRAQRTTQEAPGDLSEGARKEDVAITPLAIPMLAGPASLTTATLLSSQAESWPQQLLVYAAIALTGGITFVSLALAGRLYTWMGTTGIHVLSRILGLILAAISVQFVLDGLRDVGLIPAAP
jgi:multiple antibiotic resistance protein